jgi:2-dehydro-3-deoxyphosphooctonate aldolase (KDO 8-P synthase)
MPPHPSSSSVDLGCFPVGGEHPLFLIAGPCVLESREHTLRHAEAIQKVTAKLGIPLVFKSSFDKANRTSISSYRGPGLDEGLRWLAAVKDATGLPLLCDIHEPAQAGPAAEVADILQIPAFLCRQTDLLVAAARTGKPVNIKKAQFLSGEDMAHPRTKVIESGNDKVLLTERGNSFGYGALVVDFGNLIRMRSLGSPVIFDATHSVQRPGGGTNTTSGDRNLVAPLARAAVAVGIDGLFVEVHEDPDSAPSDGPNMLPLHWLEPLLQSLAALQDTRRSLPGLGS